jgi:hypothetical protein
MGLHIFLLQYNESSRPLGSAQMLVQYSGVESRRLHTQEAIWDDVAGLGELKTVYALRFVFKLRLGW